MSSRIASFRLLVLGPIALVVGGAAYGQSFIAEIKAEHDPGRRVQKALEFADESFDLARDSYSKGLVKKGDENLDYMTAALRECVDTLEQNRKSRFYKKAEMDVASLQRRLSDLLADIDEQDRGWAEFTNRKVDEIHDKLLAGVMRK